ncbi:hypothetical protein J6590_036779 [Homalodisca vitripennis]|nr:hypothetical protein J6590_036779 [Homalodisca vitripennis]
MVGRPLHSSSCTLVRSFKPNGSLHIHGWERVRTKNAGSGLRCWCGEVRSHDSHLTRSKQDVQVVCRGITRYWCVVYSTEVAGNVYEQRTQVQDCGVGVAKLGLMIHISLAVNKTYKLCAVGLHGNHVSYLLVYSTEVAGNVYEQRTQVQDCGVGVAKLGLMIHISLAVNKTYKLCAVGLHGTGSGLRCWCGEVRSHDSHLTRSKQDVQVVCRGITRYTGSGLRCWCGEVRSHDSHLTRSKQDVQVVCRGITRYWCVVYSTEVAGNVYEQRTQVQDCGVGVAKLGLMIHISLAVNKTYKLCAVGLHGNHVSRYWCVVYSTEVAGNVYEQRTQVQDCGVGVAKLGLMIHISLAVNKTYKLCACIAEVLERVRTKNAGSGLRCWCGEVRSMIHISLAVNKSTSCVPWDYTVTTFTVLVQDCGVGVAKLGLMIHISLAVNKTYKLCAVGLHGTGSGLRCWCGEVRSHDSHLTRSKQDVQVVCRGITRYWCVVYSTEVAGNVYEQRTQVQDCGVGVAKLGLMIHISLAVNKTYKLCAVGLHINHISRHSTQFTKTIRSEKAWS